MAQLTWREMTAPDVSTSLKGYDQFSSLLNSALGGAREAVASIDQKSKELANNQIQLALATAQDPAALKAALADPTQLAKLDPSRVDAQTIAMIGVRPGQLTQQAAQELALKDSTRLYDQAVTADTRAPLLLRAQQLSEAAGRGEKDAQSQFDAFMAANPTLLDGIGYKNAADAQKGVFDARKIGQDFTIAGNNDLRAWNADARAKNEDTRAGARLGMDVGRYNWDNEDRNTAKMADEFVSSITAGSAGLNDPNSVLAAITNSGLDKQSGSVQAAVYARIDQRFPGLFGDTSGGSGLPSVSGSGVSNAATITVGGGQLPSTVRSITDAINYGEKVLIPQTRNSAQFGLQGTGLGTSAMGLYQITSGTLKTWAPKVFRGQDLSKIDFTDPAVQDRLARNIYESVKNDPSALSETWTSISPTEARAMRGKPWEQVRNIIAEGESGGRYAGSTVDVQTNLAIRAGQEAQTGPVVSEMVAAGSTRVNPLDAVDQLRSLPRFREASPKFIREQLDKIVADGTVRDARGRPIERINYGQAAIILRDSTTENNGRGWGPGGSSLFGGSWTSNVSGRINRTGDRVNFDRRDEAVRAWRDDNPGERAAHQNDLAVNSQQLNAAQASVDVATANLARVSQAANYNLRLRPQVEIAQQVLREKQRQLGQLQQALNVSARPTPATPQPTLTQQVSSMFNDIVSGNLFRVRRTGQ